MEAYHRILNTWIRTHNECICHDWHLMSWVALPYCNSFTLSSSQLISLEYIVNQVDRFLCLSIYISPYSRISEALIIVDSSDTPRFERDIRPSLFQEACYLNGAKLKLRYVKQHTLYMLRHWNLTVWRSISYVQCNKFISLHEAAKYITSETLETW